MPTPATAERTAQNIGVALRQLLSYQPLGDAGIGADHAVVDIFNRRLAGAAQQAVLGV
jgi:hypothetical protein